MDRERVGEWVAAYERAWRTPGTDVLAGLFSVGASYRQTPYAEPVVGLGEITRMWDAERAGPDEAFQMSSDIIAVDGDQAVVRVLVRYGDPVAAEYRDLWVLRFGGDGLCHSFEEWPFSPEPSEAGGGARGVR
ncbi:MAG: nuclear transport factor 2 family protein [Micromonosporaceae bacterium]